MSTDNFCVKVFEVFAKAAPKIDAVIHFAAVAYVGESMVRASARASSEAARGPSLAPSPSCALPTLSPSPAVLCALGPRRTRTAITTTSPPTR